MSRYIDADAFETFGYAVDGGNDDFKDGFDEGVQFVLGCIDEQPTADVRENVKGEWIEDAETYYKALNERGLLEDEYSPYFVDDIACSECLAKFSVIDNETQFFKYCPNCGAKM